MKSSADVQRATGTAGWAQSRTDACTVRLVDPERVASVNARMPAEEDVVDTADVFSLLGDPRRLKLLVALLDGELCVCDLAAVTGMSESATSHALRLLRAHRVVAVRRDGRMAYYRLDDAHVRMLVDLAVAHTEHTDAIHPERSDG
ncbi:transcriptional regulator [Kribbella turkmenica]|uniref:Transcriptional regulator n=1 Tax=Kribbella turkmenica TaxID=2530375 RepID=A0A4R4WPM8_9ACTN|nr:metalloregulator ArsR/SmtB family transcription factor [Kribbella turkmenica]TDD20147.1 transcriptional regulator [Kribbella turkmenica]